MFVIQLLRFVCLVFVKVEERNVLSYAAVSQSVSESVRQSVSQSVHQSISQSISQSVISQ